jgi:hypothetical protein
MVDPSSCTTLPDSQIAKTDACLRDDGLPAVPIVIGVAGHRDPRPEDREKLKEQLVAILLEVKETYPDTPLVLMSSLAQGADQLAVEAALEHPKLDKHVWVRAALPFEPDVYCKSTSFDDDASRGHLKKWLKDERVQWLVVPLPAGFAPKETDWTHVACANDEASKKLRHACYTNAGGYIVRQAHLFVAFWDGEECTSITAQLVRFRLQGEPPEDYPWIGSAPLGFHSDRGVACVVRTPRAGGSKKGAEPEKPAGALELRVPAASKEYGATCTRPLARKLSSFARFRRRVLHALGSATRAGELEQLHELCQHTQDFNCDIVDHASDSKLRKALDRVRGEEKTLWPEGSVEWYGWRRLNAVAAAASYLSGRRKRGYQWAQFGAFAWLFAAAMSFHFYAHLHHKGEEHNWLFLLAFILSLVSGGIVVCWVWWLRLDEKQLDYRTLAEALRVRKSWAHAGLGASVVESYLGQLRGETTWARRAVYNICPPPSFWAAHFASLQNAQQQARLRSVLEEWVIGQKNFLEHSRAREHRRASWLRKPGLAFAVAGWVVLIFLLFCRVPALELDVHDPHHGWLIGPPLAVILGGLLIALCERRSHEELAQQYERLHVVFANGERELRRCLEAGNVAAAHRVVEALGREAVTENAAWLILRRARPLEVHIGG